MSEQPGSAPQPANESAAGAAPSGNLRDRLKAAAPRGADPSAFFQNNERALDIMRIGALVLGYAFLAGSLFTAPDKFIFQVLVAIPILVVTGHVAWVTIQKNGKVPALDRWLLSVGSIEVVLMVLQLTGGGLQSPMEPVLYLLALTGGALLERKEAMTISFVTVLNMWLEGQTNPELGHTHGGLLLTLVVLVLVTTLPALYLERQRKELSDTQNRLDDFQGRTRALEREAERRAAKDAEVSPDRFQLEVRSLSQQLSDNLGSAAGLLRELTDAERVLLFRPEEDGSLRLVASEGDTQGVVRSIQVREGMVAAAIRSGGLHVEEVRADQPGLTWLEDGAERPQSLYIQVLSGDEERWGLVIIEGGAGAVGPLQVDRTRRLSGLLVSLIQQAVSATASRRNQLDAEAFATASQEISQYVRTEGVGRALVSYSEAFAAYDVAALVLADGEDLVVAAVGGLPAELERRRFPIETSEGFAAQAYVHRGRIERDNMGRDERPPLLLGKEIGQLGRLESLLVLPIMAPRSGTSLSETDEQEVLGAYLLGRRDGPAFSQQERIQLEVLLNQVAATVLNARLFAEHEARAITDPMTGLPNHRRFQEVLSEQLRGATEAEPVSLLLVDVDHFKSVNDTYGHPKGDEVLKRLAGVLTRCVRDIDLAARYGGEEFVVVLGGTDGPGAARVAERMREALAAETFVHLEDGQTSTFRVTMSVGVATFPAQAEDKQGLIDHADAALYQAKEGGRNRVVRYSA